MKMWWIWVILVSVTVSAGDCPRERAITALFPDLSAEVLQEVCAGLEGNKQLNNLLGQARRAKMDDWGRVVIKLAYLDNLRRTVKKTVENVPDSGELPLENQRFFQKVTDIFAHLQKDWIRALGQSSLIKHRPEDCRASREVLSSECVEEYRLLSLSLKSFIGQQADLAAAHIKVGR